MYEEGDIADGPNGQTLVYRGGQWVPMSGGPAPVTIGAPDPTAQYAAPKAAVDLQAAQAAAARAAAAAPVQLATQQAQLETARLAAEKTRRELATAPKADTEQRGRAGTIDSLTNQINEVARLYNAGPGATSGIAGLADYLPTAGNAAFDAAAVSLEDQAAAAFRVPGSGWQSDADAARIAAANKPSRFNRDAFTNQQLSQLRSRVDTMRAAAGLPAARWYADPGQGQRTVASGATKTVTDDSKAPAIAALQTLLRSGAPDDQVQAAAAALSASPESVSRALEFRRKNPGYKGSYNLGALGTREEATTARERIAGSAAGAFTSNALNDAAAGIPGAVLGTDALEAQQAAFPNASTAGSLVGGVAGAAGLELGLARGATRLGFNAASRWLPRAADATYGGIQGATTTGTPEGALLGSVAGVSGGMLGRGAARTAGRALRGVTNPAVRYLADQGVNLTVGQTVGGSGFVGPTFKAIEQRLSGLPVVGSAIGRRYREGLEGFNRLGNAEAVAPLADQTNPLNITIPEVGERGVEALRQANSAGYANAVGGRFATADPTYDAAFNNARTMASAIPNTGPAVADELDAVVPGYFAAGSISGDNGRAAVSELRALRRARMNDPLGNRTGNAIRQAENAVTDLFERQSPGFTGDLAAANSVNGNVKTIETAVRNAGRNDGLYSPAQLDRAAQQSAARYGNNAATTQRPFFDLARAGQAVLPNTIPDSGTAGRLATLALPAALTGAGAGAGYAGGDASTGTYSGLALGALLTAGGSRGAQRLATRALLNRPDALIRIGNRVYDRAALGGMLGAGLGASGASMLAGR
jgi:hypothetical protein